MKRLIYLLPLLLIGCKEAPKEYYSAGEVEVIEHTTIVSDSDTISVDNTSKNTSFNSNEVSPEAIEYMNKKDFYTFYFYTELIGTIIVTIFLYYIIF